MGRGAVAFVTIEAVEGEIVVVGEHEVIAGYLCKDGGSGNGVGEAVAMDEILLGEGVKGELDGVGEEVIGGEGERGERQMHGTDGGLENVDLIYERGIYNANAVGDSRRGRQHFEEVLTFARGEELAVIDIGEKSSLCNDARRRYDRPRERPATCLIYTRNALEALPPDLSLKGKERLLVFKRLPVRRV